MKKILILPLCFFIFLSNNSFTNDSHAIGKSIHLTFRVLGWQPREAIGIKYQESVSKEQIQADMEALAEAHGWTYSENPLEIRYEKGKKVAWQEGALSEKHRLNTDFTLNFQALREQFPDAESIIIDVLSQNGFAYQNTFTSAVTASGEVNSDNQKWQSQFPFQKNWTGMANYRIRYTLQHAQLPINTILPMLKATATFSKPWLLKVVPFLVFLIFLPSATLYLFLRPGVSRNERGKVKLKPLQSIFINVEFHIGMGAAVYLGCVNICSALTQSTLFGFLLSVVPVAATSYLLFLRVLHHYEKASRGTTWRFRENLLTNLRMMVLGAPALLLPFCFLGTLKVFPHLSFFAFGILLLVQYAILTVLFACMIPFVLGWVWKGKPLEDDTIRQRLQELAQKAGIDYRDIILLQTKESKLANAWVAGILPKWRTVFITDYLLEHLKHDEIETIFAHELGHLKHRHLLKQVVWIVIGFGGQLLLVRLSLFLFSFLTGIPSWAHWLLFVSINFGVLFLLVQFGLMRFWRRMEFEADAYAVELTQWPNVFLQALRTLIQLNDAPEDLDKFNEMLSTHPNFKVRADAVEKLNVQGA